MVQAKEYTNVVLIHLKLKLNAGMSSAVYLPIYIIFFQDYIMSIKKLITFFFS